MTQVKLGDKNIPFIYQGNELLYPNPVKDGLVLWYDFKGMRNNDVSKDVAKDLSGNGNDGALRNFNYTSESGYNNGLKFDNIDDRLITSLKMTDSFTISMSIDIKYKPDVQFILGGNLSAFYIRKNLNDLHASMLTGNSQQITTVGGNRFFYYLEQSGNSKCQIDFMIDIDKKLMSVYGNGELVSNREFEEGSVREWTITNLGAWSSSGNTNNLDGSILSTKVYNRALSDQEIQHNYDLEKERWNL